MIEISTVVGMFYLADVSKNEPLVREKFTNSAFKGLEWTNLISQVSSCLSHWLFAVEYFKLALKFPIMISQLTEEEIEKRQKRNYRILVGLNVFFYI